jgi:hypothetical protein
VFNLWLIKFLRVPFRRISQLAGQDWAGLSCRRDFGSGGIFPGVITPGYFQASFPDAKTDGTANSQPMRSLLNGAWAIGGLDATTMPRRWRFGGKGRRLKRGIFAYFACFAVNFGFF